MVDQLAPEVLASKPSVKRQAYINSISVWKLELTYITHEDGGMTSLHERPGRQPINHVESARDFPYVESAGGFGAIGKTI